MTLVHVRVKVKPVANGGHLAVSIPAAESAGRDEAEWCFVTTVGERWQGLWNGLKAQQAQLPSHVSIPPENVDTLPTPITPFEARSEYFQVVVNEMYLSKSREWVTVYDPMVLAVTEFAYGGQVQTVPVVVGPALLGKGVDTPQGMLYSNTRVAGLHPFAGARFVSTLILYRVERQNYIKDVLRVVERAAAALNVATALTVYIQLADVILDGVEALVGFKETKPVVGARSEFGVGASRLVPSYIALVDLPAVKPNELAVRGSQLYDASTGEPFRRADYVLCSIEKVAERDDETLLPFFEPLWKRVVEDATKANAESWKSAKANMLALAQAILLSPDLTEPQKATLVKKCTEKMKGYRGMGQDIVKLGPDDVTAIGAVRNRTVGILDLE